MNQYKTLYDKDEVPTIRSGGGNSLSKKHCWDMIKVKQINNSKESGGMQPYQQNRVFDADGLSPTIDQSAGRFSVAVKSATKDGFETAKKGDSVNLSIPKSTTRRGRVGKQQAQTLDTQSNQGVIVAQRGRGEGWKQELEERKDGNTNTLTGVTKDNLLLEGVQIRRLTEIECERLQGFPDNHTKFGIYNGVVKLIPQTARYKLMGNAVTVNVVQLIGSKMLAI